MATRTINGCAAVTAAAMGAALLGWVAPAFAAAKVTVDRNEGDKASPAFKFEHVPPPAKDDAAAKAKFSVPAGQVDGNGADADALHDGKTPTEQDEPAANFFFGQGEKGGRVQIDLGAATEVSQVNTYSWHPDTRGPQVYKLYAADGKAEKFDAAPKAGVDPAKAGWTLLAEVDTRPKQGDPGGQYGVSVADADGKPLGSFRYLLLDASATETDDPFGNTFYSEVDVVAAEAKKAAADAPATGATVRTTVAAGKYEISIDTAGLDEAMAKWAEEKLRPVCEEWYPKIVEMLPSEGYEAPKRFGIVFRDDMGGTPAAAGGTRVMCNRQWFEKNLKGEAVGAVVHEMVHVVQQYRGPRGKRPPFWLQEGIPDYIRWYLYEPEKHGADIRNPDRAKYDAAYRVSANFLNWATLTYDKQLVPKVNAAIRGGKYTDDLFKELTGKALPALDAEWKASLAQKKKA